MAEQRVNVLTEDLIEKVLAARATALAAHQKECEAYPKALEKWQKDALAKLETAINKVINGRSPTNNWGGVDVPTRPAEPVLKTGKLDQDLALLRITADTTIRVSVTSNWGRYL